MNLLFIVGLLNKNYKCLVTEWIVQQILSFCV